MAPHIFVSADNAQIVAFVAKIVVGLTVPRVSAVVSYFSAPKALIFYFFGDFSNVFALANDMRWFPSVRKTRTRPANIHAGTLITVVLACCMAAAVLVTDLLLFQLSERQEGFVFKPTDTPLVFHDLDYTQLGEDSIMVPEVLSSVSSANSELGSNLYIPGDKGQYMNYSFAPLNFSALDGPEGNIAWKSDAEGYSRCTVAHSVYPDNVWNGDMPAKLLCFYEKTFSNATNIWHKSVNTFGSDGQTIASWFQTAEGANYLFVEPLQRFTTLFQNENSTSGTEILKQMVDGFTAEGYSMVMALVDGSSVNPAIFPKEYSDPWFLIEDSVKQALLQDFIEAETILLFSKTETTLKYGRIPVHTKKNVLWGTALTRGFFNNTGSGNYYSYSYDTRQYLVKDKSIRSNLYGVSNTDIGLAPQSVQFLTNRTDEEIILATLNSTTPPIQVVPTELLDIFPGVVVVAICGAFVICSLLFSFVARLPGGKDIVFDVNLEVYHKGLSNLDCSNAGSIPAKFESTDNLVMTRGTNLMTNALNVGLAVKSNGKDLTAIGMESMSATPKTPFSPTASEACFEPAIESSESLMHNRTSTAYSP